MEDRSGWYEAEVLMADLTGHHHTMRGAREEEIEARMLLLYPGASTLLVRPEEDAGLPPSAPPAGASDYRLVGLFPYGLPR